MPHKDPKVRKAYLEEYLKRPETIKRRKEYRERNREKSNSNHKIYYQNNKKKIDAKNKKWVAENREKANLIQKKWRKNNPEKVKAIDILYKKKKGKLFMQKKMRDYLERNREKRILRKKERFKTDINFKIRERVGVRIRNGLNFFNLKKYRSTRTVDLLGCSYAFYSNYLQRKFKRGMTWKNFGKNGWEIDHIKPLAKFDLKKISEQKKAFNYKNTQPLWRKENRLKADS